MQKFRFDYKGLGGCSSWCDVSILSEGNIVVLHEREDNQGTSVTNMSEHIANQIYNTYLSSVSMEKIRWVEHYEHGLGGEESWDNVHYNIIKGRYANPTWTPALDFEAKFSRESK